MAILKTLSIISLSPPPKSAKFSSLLSLGIVMSLSTGLANVSLKFNRCDNAPPFLVLPSPSVVTLCSKFCNFFSVGFYQMAKIAVTPAIVLAEFILFSKRISRQKVTLHRPIYELFTDISFLYLNEKFRLCTHCIYFSVSRCLHSL